MRQSLRRVGPPCLLAKVSAKGTKQVVPVPGIDAEVADAIQGLLDKSYGRALCDQLQLRYGCIRGPQCLVGFSSQFGRALVLIFDHGHGAAAGLAGLCALFSGTRRTVS